eukprot:362800-Chlamydomonas_euryale.AAC.2
MDGWMDERMCGYVDGCGDGCADGWTVGGWADGWMNGRRDEWKGAVARRWWAIAHLRGGHQHSLEDL